MTADDPAARPSASEVARILHDPPTLSQPARTVVAEESATRVRTKPMTIPLGMATPGPAPVRSRQRRGGAWLAAAGVLAAVMIIAVLVWLLPRGGLSPGSGQQAPTMSPGPDRLHQDLQDLQRAVQP
jgi:hypothetical protein